MADEQPGYLAYLLRLWQENGQWRASLERPRSGERTGFASLKELFAFLEQEIDLHQQKRSGVAGNNTQKE
ncbi:MAG: hypothetical protein KDE31_37785 [Caldilineaceae bacterium]|nr:hypothetical protein [Caldilineaceae bacterium]